MPDIKRTVQEEPVQEAVLTQPPMKKKSNLGSKIGAIIVIIIVILVGLFLISKYTSWNVLKVNKNVSTTDWQAVFLSNGQVYFGKIDSQSNDTIVLSDIYYLQVSSPIQPVEADQGQQNLSLVKLGNELHGPSDEMKINRDHVLFTEKLKADSKVVDAIVRYLETGE